MPKLTTEEFIARAKAVHGDKYDYSKVEYVNTKTPVIVVCPKHGIYKVTPESHILRHQGCPICGKEKKGIPTTQEEFLVRAIAIHGDKYDFSEAVYVNSLTKVKGVCSKHGEFWVTPSALIHKKAGCPLCAQERFSDIRRKSQEQFIEDCKRVWGEVYDYSKVSYINSTTPITVICKKHGLSQFYLISIFIDTLVVSFVVKRNVVILLKSATQKVSSRKQELFMVINMTTPK